MQFLNTNKLAFSFVFKKIDDRLRWFLFCSHKAFFLLSIFPNFWNGIERLPQILTFKLILIFLIFQTLIKWSNITTHFLKYQRFETKVIGLNLSRGSNDWFHMKLYLMFHRFKPALNWNLFLADSLNSDTVLLQIAKDCNSLRFV